MEVGLGGRYDATNIVTPTLTIITNVTMEHEFFLGENIESITKEKAGIIKNVPIVTAATGKAQRIIERAAKKNNVQLTAIGKDVEWRCVSPNSFVVNTKQDCYHIKSPLHGTFQGENIAVAIASAELFGIKKKNIVEGIRKTKLHGRMEIIGQVLLDGAHNPAAIRALTHSLQGFSFKNLILVFGVMKDKNIKKMIDALPVYTQVYTTMAENDRAYDSKSLAELLENATPTLGVEDAIKKALKQANVDDLICVTGSLYVVGEARGILKATFKQNKDC
jgi:dihydrofolate synthase/folylpolyglutamate synthase